MMKISIKDDHIPADLTSAIVVAFMNTRFSFDIKTLPKGINITKVRLQKTKPYCGNHPNACEVGGGLKMLYLEGLDWVEFNDRINDVLDANNVNARVYTMVCELRRGNERRIRYDSYFAFNQWEWVKEGDNSDYDNYCGRIAPPSIYPQGTPGLYERNILWTQI